MMTAQYRDPGMAERAARARRLARPQAHVMLVCGHPFYTRGHPLGPGAEVWCVACDCPSCVAGDH